MFFIPCPRSRLRIWSSCKIGSSVPSCARLLFVDPPQTESGYYISLTTDGSQRPRLPIPPIDNTMLYNCNVATYPPCGHYGSLHLSPVLAFVFFYRYRCYRCYRCKFGILTPRQSISINSLILLIIYVLKLSAMKPEKNNTE